MPTPEQEINIQKYKIQRGKLKDNKRTYERRRKYIQEAYDNSYKMDGRYEDVKKFADDCEMYLSRGFNGISSISDKCTHINEQREKGSLPDLSDYSDALLNMSRAINACDEKISNDNSELDRYKNLIHDEGGHVMVWE